MTDVVLEVIDAGNWREALDVLVRDDQLAFVADHQPVALVILAKCFVRPGGRRWEPLLVRDARGLTVGVLALEHGPDGCELRNFAIDARRQEKVSAPPPPSPSSNEPASRRATASNSW